MDQKQKDNSYSSYSNQQKKEDKIEPLISQKYDFQNDNKHTSNYGHKEENKTEKNLDKANRMLEEVTKEEKHGYKAEIHTSFGDNKRKETGKREDDIIDTYGDDFDEDIEEDLPEDNHLLDSHGNVNPQRGITESLGGVTVSQSLGVDPSVDSLALEDYDHIEPVERIS